ncbi:fumarylacetoacetate (FAA) hydrolase family protein [Pseudomonas sp. SORGH_AS 211]|uniref:fumarylacetoacetate hydrolase family protein n=1 Tax=Pseudomonas sp. SORGH_AS_0211 TaxID=3041796 RepID=UPI0028562E72|nr:fumarylacetoacetate hydrolase family protein [Pseudomonas sp. SORGH_AS_0211]MDR6179663.1 fumarylacetoacetate (FAA) hydrolase family protein [Pseudomonas sp. SORGH_AS_0211]
MSLRLSPANTLPVDGLAGTLVGRAWVPGPLAGPSPVVLREDGVFDVSQSFATLSALFEEEAPLQALRDTPGRYLGSVEELLANSGEQADPDRLHLLPPADLQVIKAAGVTFAASMLERVIEEQAGGDAGRAVAIREQVQAVIGADLQGLEPGSPRAQALKALLIEKGMWSQYLEVGIGPDAEIFTKAPVLASVGSGSAIGIHPVSQWNNPEPEVVLVADSRGRLHGATLGNDVNLRDIEGRSALLLSKAKDNNASCALGPFIRLFDETFDLDRVRQCVVTLEVQGEDGFHLKGSSSMAQISRDPTDLAAQTLNANHQYPDGFVLFLGTLFAPTQDRDAPGGGFTHKVGDRVSIASPLLGTLHNRVTTSDQAPAWRFGLGALMHNLAARGLLGR